MKTGVEMTASADPSLVKRARQALDWLFEDALPASWAHGRNPAGGWYDRLDDDLRPTDAPMRLLVQTRQVFVFAEAGRLGWPGPWREAMEHGLGFMRERATGADGRLARTFEHDGRVLDGKADLYTQAFVLFAYAVAYGATGDPAHRNAALVQRDRLAEGAARPGFRDADSAHLRANPNMHLFEAFLHWAEVDEDPAWRRLAEEQARLCRERLVGGADDALREVFNEDWRPAAPPAGDCTEPGHHYEWAWLLTCADPADQGLPLRLCERAERVGVDPTRGVAVNTVHVSGEVLDADARLWPQTERLKAALVMRSHDERAWTARACEAHDSLFRYMGDSPPGLWRDVMRPDGSLRPEAAPISSLYHIVGAISELARATGTAEARW